MNAEDFQKLLEELNACRAAREWIKGKALGEFWDTCDRADWLFWLCVKTAGRSGWPSEEECRLAAQACIGSPVTDVFESLTEKIGAETDKARKLELLKQYAVTMRPLLKVPR